jgi:signal peptide peptidase SppA
VEGVAVIPVMGTLMLRAGTMDKQSGMADYLDIREAIKTAELDERVSAIMLHIDSPGGMCMGCEETAAAFKMAEKPTIAYTDGMMDSAAYWIGSQADVVYMSPSARAGSIGVYMSLLDVSQNYAAQGIKRETFATGQYKAMGLEGTSLTDEQRTLLQAEVDDIFARFARAVVAARDLVQPDSMQGQDFSAIEAINRNLADAIGRPRIKHHARSGMGGRADHHRAGRAAGSKRRDRALETHRRAGYGAFCRSEKGGIGRA